MRRAPQRNAGRRSEDGGTNEGISDDETTRYAGDAGQQLDPGHPDAAGSSRRRTGRRQCAPRSRTGGDVMSRSPLNVMAISNDALRPELLDMLLVDGSTYEVIVVESIARAYS